MKLSKRFINYANLIAIIISLELAAITIIILLNMKGI